MEQEFEIDSSVLDAAHFVALTIEHYFPEFELEMYMEQLWRPAWEIIIPHEEEMKDVEELAFELVKDIYMTHGILIGYKVRYNDSVHE